MTPDAPSRKNLWEALSLLEDWLTTGFSRRTQTEIEIEIGGSEAPEPLTGPTASEAPEPRAVPAPASAPAPAPVAAAVSAAQVAAPADRDSVLRALAAEVASCARCGLSANRTTTVPGEGSLDAPVMFVGEGPGAEEDRTGRPFVGAAGQYLDRWLKSIDLERSACFIANCVKCRPPQNREPHPEEIGACLPFLLEQIAAVKPRVICCLGRISAQTLLGTTSSLGALRGRIHQRGGIPVVVTYHPSAVLRDQSLRKPVWEDLKMLQKLLQ